MTLGDTRRAQSGLWVRRGRTQILPPGIDDGFILGTTFPDATNTGTYAGIDRIAYSGPTSIVGSTDPDNPTLVDNANVTSLITITSGYVHFFNCALSGGPGTFNTGLVDCRASGVLGVTFERCDFDPGVNASYWLNAVIGHHMTLIRCRARRVVDFVGSYNTHSATTNNVIEGNWVEWLVRYAVDADHSDGTHNDGIQHQGGNGVRIVGNRLDGYTFLADGVTVPPSPYLRGGQGIIIQQNVAIGGVYNSDDVEIVDNWFSGWQHPIMVKTRNPDAEPGTGPVNNPLRIGTPWDAIITGNRWLNDDQRYYGTSVYGGVVGTPYIIRVGNQTTVNGVSYPTDGSLNYDLTANNRYLDVPEVVRVPLRGQNVPIRRDNFGG